MSNLKTKNMKVKQFFFIGFVFLNSLCFCFEESFIDDTSKITQLPPLSYLIEIACNNSPLIRNQENIIEQKGLELKMEKKSWLNYISLNSNYSRGTNNAQINGSTVVPTYTTTASNWYNAGVSINLPFSALANKKHNTSLKKLNQSIEEDNLELLRKNIKLLIADLYSDIELKMKVLELRADAVLQSNLNYEYAEIEFKNNTISIAELSKVHEENVKAKIQYEESKKDYWLAIKLLEENVGQKIK